MTDEETKAQYNTYIAPDIGAMQERIRKAMIKGVENAKIRSEKQRKLADLRARRYRRQEVTEEYEI
ncbi:MAG: hypothetical protein WBO49_04075 [Candidatus Saccharimonas sp.]